MAASLDLALLNVLTALWDTRSVTRTAARLDMSQSSVSGALNRLRACFDDRLFVWDGHRMTPTPRTAAIVEDARRILQQVESLTHPPRAGPLALRRHFVVATADYVAAICGPRLMARRAREAPGLVLEFVDVRPEMLNKGGSVGIDFFLLPASRLQTAGLKATVAYGDRYVCLSRSRTPARLAALADREAFLALPHVGYSSIARTVFSHEAIAWSHDQSPDYGVLGPHYLAAALIATGSDDAVAIVPARVAEVLPDACTDRVFQPPLDLPEISMTLYWEAEAERDPGHLWVRDALLEACARPPESAPPIAAIASERLRKPDGRSRIDRNKKNAYSGRRP